QNLERAASLGNFVLGRSAESVSVNGQFILQIAIAQNFYLLRGTNKPMRAKQIRRYRFACRKSIQILQVNYGKGFSKRAAKAALWNAAVQWHLAAFKSTPARIAATRLLALIAGSRSSPQLRADAAANPHFAFTRATRRAKRFKIERVAAFFISGLLAGCPVRCFFDDLLGHDLSPPLPRGAAPYGSYLAFQVCSGARPPDADGAGPAHESFAAC